MSNPGEWPEQRVGLFVDTQNLYYAARQAFERRVDYEKLLHVALRGRRLASATAYVVERPGESVAFGFVTKLSSLGYRVRRKKSIERRSEHGDVVIDGDWDMGIAADIVRAWDGLEVDCLSERRRRLRADAGAGPGARLPRGGAGLPGDGEPEFAGPGRPVRRLERGGSFAGLKTSG